jgi:mono/diheme cytochrome c family protein
MKKTVVMLAFAVPFLFASCGGGEAKNEVKEEVKTEAPAAEETADGDYDSERGIGNFDNIEAGALDKAMADKGKGIAQTKCFSCHKPTTEKLVGPGWAGVTQRRTLHWIMNFITNPDPNIDKDPEVKKQLEECLVRMPNQNLAENDARSIVEFMRQNDGAK